MRRRLAAALAVAAAAGAGAAAGAPASRVEADWMLHCQGCHGADGRGAPGRVPTLEDVGRFLAVPGGRAYLVQVPGTAQAALDDAAIAALLDWMLRRFSAASLPADHVPYTAAEVGAWRAQPLLDPAAARRELLDALAGPERAGPGAR